MKHTRRIAVILIIAATPTLAFAGSGWFHVFGRHKHHEQSCATCRARIETKKVEKTCFETECVQKCIPKVTFPWQKRHTGCDDGCDSCGTCNPRCGKVITVNTLKKRKYECEEPVCKWEIEAGYCDECCDSAGGKQMPDPGGAEPGVVSVPQAPLAPPVSERVLEHQPR